MADKEPNTYAKKLASGEMLWSWQPTSRDSKNHCPLSYEALGSDFASAMVKARKLNERLYTWRAERRAGKDETSSIKGTFGWLLVEYEKHGLHGASDGYRAEVARYIRIAGDMKMAGGTLFVHKELESVSVKMAQNCLNKMKEKRGGSTAKKFRAICSAAWSEGYRLNEKHVPERNPWSHVKLQHTESETYAATYDQLQSFVSTAIVMNEIGMAIAARLCWDMHIRPTEVFRSTVWADYRPDHKPNHFLIRHEKRNTGGWQILDDPDQLRDGVAVTMFPELESLLRMASHQGPLICMREQQRGNNVLKGQWHPIKKGSSICRRIAMKAGLPSDVTLASFRHGGITDLGESGVDTSMMQSRTKHRQRASLDRYDHSNDKKSAAAQRLRLAHRSGS
jgi:hypothetical protein